MLIPLRSATRPRCGSKAATLSTLLRDGFAVPDGFVVPSGYASTFDARQEPARARLTEAVTRELAAMGDPVVAVRSSAANEDTEDASAAGQHASILGARGAAAVCDAIAVCQESAASPQVGEYLRRVRAETADDAPSMAVLVQRLVAADVSGVMFTPERGGGTTRIEASWGLGSAVVGGLVTPDGFEVSHDGDVRWTIGTKQTRTDLHGEAQGVIDSAVDDRRRAVRTLSDDDARSLAALGARIATSLGAAQDVEWAIADGQAWVLQARPITAALPPSVGSPPLTDATLAGAPASPGVVTAQARIVRGPGDFRRVRPGDIVVCTCTDPAWTPLLAIAAGVIAEIGGTLSHAAIVAREFGIPAVLGVTGAMQRIRDDDRVTLDGTAGLIAPA